MHISAHFCTLDILVLALTYYSIIVSRDQGMENLPSLVPRPRKQGSGDTQQKSLAQIRSHTIQWLHKCTLITINYSIYGRTHYKFLLLVKLNSIIVTCVGIVHEFCLSQIWLVTDKFVSGCQTFLLCFLFFSIVFLVIKGINVILVLIPEVFCDTKIPFTIFLSWFLR